MDRAEVAVVGAGPAGLAAATLLAAYGVDVVVVDERPRPGGQIYRQPPAGFGDGATGAGASAAPGRKLLRAAAAADLRWRTRTLAWGLFEGRDGGLAGEAGEAREPSEGWVVALADAAGIDRLAAAHVLVASGAYDLPFAFPGWTLPGVMAAGGVQAFLKSDKLLPGRRFLLAGGHPLLLVVADQLLHAGAEIAAVVVAQPRPRLRESLAAAGRLHGRVARLAELVGPLRTLRRARVPLLFSHLIASAEGDGDLEAASVIAVDDGWRPLAGATPRRFTCDTLALGYGFVPSLELLRQAACAVRWREQAGGWVCVHDGWQRTTRAGVSVAGETTGIAGADQAIEEGRLAALGILVSLGRLDESSAARAAAPVRRALARQRRLSALVQERFAPRYAALAALARDDTLVCRCEEITAGALRQALAAHPHLGSVDALKLLTRVGMGRCQGRFCLPSAASLLAQASGRDFEQVGAFAARAPVRPLPVWQLAAGERDPT